MGRTVCLTSFELADLGPARVLAETVKAAHPDWTMQAMVIERPGWAVPAEAFAPFDVVTSVLELDIPRVRPWLFGIDRAAIRLPAAACGLHRALESGADWAVYLDANSAVFHPLAATAQGGGSVLLAPQMIAPSETEPAFRDGELAAMRLGIFSPGFIAARGDAEGRGFAAWFDGMVRRPIADARLAGAPPAPLLCNLAPALFSGINILRDPGYNVAPVNICRRRLRVAPDGSITVNGALLRHFQFPGPATTGEMMLDRHGHGDIALYELLAWYRRQTARLTVPEVAALPWSFGSFDDATPVTPPIRRLWRERADLYRAFEDPFATGPGTLHDWLGRERPDLMVA